MKGCRPHPPAAAAAAAENSPHQLLHDDLICHIISFVPPLTPFKLVSKGVCTAIVMNITRLTIVQRSPRTEIQPRVYPNLKEVCLAGLPPHPDPRGTPYDFPSRPKRAGPMELVKLGLLHPGIKSLTLDEEVCFRDSELQWLLQHVCNQLEELRCHFVVHITCDALPASLQRLEISAPVSSLCLTGLHVRCPRLQLLDFQGSKLTGQLDLPPSLLSLTLPTCSELPNLSALTALQSLDVSDCTLLEPLALPSSLTTLCATLPTHLPHLLPRLLTPLTRLRELRLTSHNLQCDRLPLLPALTRLDCSGSHCPALGGLAAKLPELRELAVDRCHLVSLDCSDPALAPPSTLTKLDCSSNRNLAIEGLGECCPHLTELDCSKISMSTLETARLPASLRVLDATNNQLASLAGLQQCTALTRLDVSYNQLASLQHAPCSLRSLDVIYNQLASLTPLSGCTALTQLRCSNNCFLDSLAGLGPGGAGGLQLLQQLDVDHCGRLTSLAGLERCRDLAVLQCDFSPVHSLEPLRQLTSLTRLHCGCIRQLTSMAPIEALPRLAVLRCCVQVTGVSALPTLRSLDIAGSDCWDLDSWAEEHVPRCPALTQLIMFRHMLECTPHTQLMEAFPHLVDLRVVWW